MTPKHSPSPREEWEMRVTAMLLGELPPAEAAAIRDQIAVDPELVALQTRLQKAMDLLREATADTEEPAPDAPVQLSSERRERLLAHFKTPVSKPAPKTVPFAVKKTHFEWSRLVPLSIAAVLVAFFGVFVLGLNGLVQRKGAVSRVEDFGLQVGVATEGEARNVAPPPAAQVALGTTTPDVSFSQFSTGTLIAGNSSTIVLPSVKQVAGVFSEDQKNDQKPAFLGANGSGGDREGLAVAQALGYEFRRNPAQEATTSVSPIPAGSAGSNASANSFGGTSTVTLGNNNLITKSGSGTLELTGANTFTGATTVTNGALRISGAISGTGGVSVGNTVTGAEVPPPSEPKPMLSDLNGSNQVIGLLTDANTYSGTTTINGGTLTFGGSTNSFTAEQIYGLTPRYPNLDNAGTSRVFIDNNQSNNQPGSNGTLALKELVPKSERLYASVDELYFGANSFNGLRRDNMDYTKEKPGSSATDATWKEAQERLRKFLAPEQSAKPKDLQAQRKTGEDPALQDKVTELTAQLADVTAQKESMVKERDEARAVIEAQSSNAKVAEVKPASELEVFEGRPTPAATPPKRPRNVFYGGGTVGYADAPANLPFEAPADAAKTAKVMEEKAARESAKAAIDDYGVIAHNQTRARPVADATPAAADPTRKFKLKFRNESGDSGPPVAGKESIAAKATDVETQRKIVQGLQADAAKIRARGGIVDPDPDKDNSQIGHAGQTMSSVQQQKGEQEIRVVELERQLDAKRSLPAKENPDALTILETRLRYEKDKLSHLEQLAADSRATEIAEKTPMADYLDAKNKYLRAQKALAALEAADVAPERKLPSQQAAAVPQPEIQTRDNAFSTFSLNVSDVSFKLAAASLEQGRMPDVSTVRSEEFINAFDYRDPEPAPGAPLAFASERARYPFAQNRDLLRFSVKTAAAGRQPGRPLNIVLLLDKSGSMERADRVSIVREALRVLTQQLQPQDRLSIVTFARTPRLWADGVAGNKAGELIARVSEITPEGGTNLEAALDLGYETAQRHFAVTSINRVVLFTDGAANLGDVNPEALTKKVEAKRKQGVALDCFGIGWEDFNDDLLEQLTRNGDGRYGFINSPEEAATTFAAQLVGAFQVAASDVKVQVEFNPRRVTAYRQIGYAKHQLTKEQFRDNSVAAAQIGAAESGNALYVVAVDPQGEGDLATVRVRYRVPGTSDFQEHEWVVSFTGAAPALPQAAPALRLAGTASAFSEMLAASPYSTEVTSDRLLNLLAGVPTIYGADPRPQKLEWMIRQVRSISGH